RGGWLGPARDTTTSPGVRGGATDTARASMAPAPPNAPPIPSPPNEPPNPNAPPIPNAPQIQTGPGILAQFGPTSQPLAPFSPDLFASLPGPVQVIKNLVGNGPAQLAAPNAAAPTVFNPAHG